MSKTEKKSDIFNMLVAAGILFVGGTMVWDRRGEIGAWISDKIDAVREALTLLRYGSEMSDLQSAISTLRAAGIGVPNEIENIAWNPRDGNSEIPAVNLAMARGYLESALQHLEQAQSMASSEDDMGKSASGRVGAHHLYR